ncbi:zf-HC2 domain-containing protein [Accumulibacter sp.]|uniref:zf-HC2 domain-containing protein n=1 Tax=Accumulibacter sp. TaxID=2053492 RepID=UPI00261E1351|nr:zf-HC2 domain-containing protein [Accumulibacter sp.]
MRKCREAAHLCSDALERELTLRERVTMRAHLMICLPCRNFRTHLAFVRQAMRRYAAGKSGTVPDDS